MIKKIFIAVISIFFLIMVTLVHSRFVSTKGLITKEYMVTDNNLPVSFNDLKILHFSDILYNSNTYNKDIDRILEESQIIESDIVIFSGDLISSKYELKASNKEYLINILSQIKATYGKYAILGDNDYSDINTVKDIYLNSGFTILDNEYDIIYNDNNDEIFIGGVSSSLNNQADIDAIMNYFKTNDDISYKIIIMHEPDYLDKVINNYNINLIIAGHSLNGQINIPLIKNLFLQSYSNNYYDNYYYVNNTNIYISSGIGVYKSNFRLLNKPSINFYRLKSE